MDNGNLARQLRREIELKVPYNDEELTVAVSSLAICSFRQLLKLNEKTQLIISKVNK